jgi:CubicO group peptidase (beta-lactamase class C family)
MKLVEDGKLRLDDKVFGVNGILNDPRFLKYKDKRVEEITVHNLLNHSVVGLPAGAIICLLKMLYLVSLIRHSP